jgi:cysteine desulfurase/selenocysteine lyase
MNNKLYEQFPILQTKVNDKPLIYLDNAATTQKPRAVVEAMESFYFHDNANVHRGIYKLSENATLAYEKSRENIATFIGAKKASEIIFVRGTTEAINLVAASYGSQNFGSGDEIIISTMEHHSNIVPWQLISEKTGAKLQVIKIHGNGELDFQHYERLFNSRTKIVAITHVSNSLGTINPAKKIIATAHAHNVPVLVDGAQAAAHLPIDVRDLDCDFYAFSAHKMYGPTFYEIGRAHV